MNKTIRIVTLLAIALGISQCTNRGQKVIVVPQEGASGEGTDSQSDDDSKRETPSKEVKETETEVPSKSGEKGETDDLKKEEEQVKSEGETPSKNALETKIDGKTVKLEWDGKSFQGNNLYKVEKK